MIYIKIILSLLKIQIFDKIEGIMLEGRIILIFKEQKLTNFKKVIIYIIYI